MAWEPPRLKLGLVGCSWFALRAHVPALLALEQRVGVRLTAVCSRTRKSMARAEAKIHAADPEREVRRFAKMEQLFADADVDAVLLVLPIPLMPAAVEAALRAGKHVLSEKPAAPSIEAARRLLDAIAELGPRAPVWLVLENWQFKPSVRWLRERLQEGAIGRVAGEGAWLVDAGVHWARLLREALGEPVEGSAALCSGADGAGGGSLCGWGELGALCLWAAEEGGGHRCGRARVALERFGGEATTQLLDGDGWVEGGVAESLEHALTAALAAAESGAAASPLLSLPPTEVSDASGTRFFVPRLLLPCATAAEGEGGAAEPGPTARWVSLEYALPRAALAELVATLGSAGFLAASGCAGKTLELKFVGGPGRAEQGVNADGPVVCANVLWRVALPAGWGRLAALERVLAGLGGRPHLGKCHGLA
ncbi:hypothetical protein EMIHUDRAFT_217210 [Emiliania huxleyi CCMP1516]|uniref:Gfo/Idh/MocA-like oxidoreductase N-terminal domain-containing protein n=2 Tax=Emiliania huxleyi TaxID=2903 RepID=A0A0D3IB87_EMIH1|nr:hypothetical protein EMIHUDRAFT_217210 [Emiliania huxleyi CCMP1516]EOD08522.1 hypothetical protein EMIHUDRAFT_217210 [Emiliania huxleyi CCMP1516]|eukprot:XP_005760951.1 hypothetical protein EMIHUDRAFT_217210 [Emiliania huxleyi CCMP1516]